MKFRKKPVVIEARQLTNDAFWDVYRWVDLTGNVVEWCWDKPEIPFAERFLKIGTLEGNMKAQENDWIIKGVQGEFYPCKPDIFEATYEKVE